MRCVRASIDRKCHRKLMLDQAVVYRFFVAVTDSAAERSAHLPHAQAHDGTGTGP